MNVKWICLIVIAMTSIIHNKHSHILQPILHNEKTKTNQKIKRFWYYHTQRNRTTAHQRYQIHHTEKQEPSRNRKNQVKNLTKWSKTNSNNSRQSQQSNSMINTTLNNNTKLLTKKLNKVNRIFFGFGKSTFPDFYCAPWSKPSF